jgi:FlaA1/EpsC-like NDP-sugar epimerase
MIGIRPGEKIDELLVSPNEVARTVDFGDYYVIMPYVPIKKAISRYKNRKKVDFKFYSSANTELLSQGEIKDVLRRNNFLKKGYEYEELIGSLDKETLKRLAKNEKWLI